MKFIRSVIALLFLLAFAITAEAQPRLDSLLQQIKNEPDTVKAGVLSRLCWQYRSLDPTYALTAGEEALKYLNSDSDLWKKSEVLNYLGVIHGNIGNLDKAYFYYRQALDISTEINDSTQIGYCFDNIGDYYAKNALYSTALEYFMLSFKVFEKINNKQGMAYALNDMGEAYLFQNDYRILGQEMDAGHECVGGKDQFLAGLRAPGADIVVEADGAGHARRERLEVAGDEVELTRQLCHRAPLPCPARLSRGRRDAETAPACRGPRWSCRSPSR